LARPIVLISYLFRLADAIKFLERTIHPPLVRHLDPSLASEHGAPLLHPPLRAGHALVHLCRQAVMVMSGLRARSLASFLGILFICASSVAV
jgi:hypothetical protein